VSQRKRELSGDEKKLWRRVAESVKTRRPLPPTEDIPPAPTKKAATKARSEPPKTPPRERAAPAELADRGGEKRVRRGRVEIGGTLDLHGHTQTTGRAALARFLQVAHQRGDRAVIVVTGVGRAGQGVLKRLLPDWLRERDIRPLVAGYSQAHRHHGGAGAYYVFLKRRADIFD